MSKKYKRLYMGLFLFLLSICLSFDLSFADTNLVSLESGYAYSSQDVNEILIKLVERYPKILEIELLGKSLDGNPIYVLRMTENIKQYNEEDYVEKMHFLIEAGMHARETFNPIAVIKIIEDYAIDYYSDSYSNDLNMKNILKKSVIHFIPLSNPDGFDFSKYGLGSIKNSSIKNNLINSIPNLYLDRFKSNLNGVDLNRNFPDRYYDTDKNLWIDQWGENLIEEVASEPSLGFYKGSKAGSELETQLLMSYLLKYDFRAYLSYHSMGQVVFYYNDYVGKKYLNLNKKYANIATGLTRYEQVPPTEYIGYGYLSHFVINNTLKPVLTIETMPTNDFPTPQIYYASEYYGNRLSELPQAIFEQAFVDGYYDFKLYVDNVYVRDFFDGEYACAIAEQLNGDVYNYEGKPTYRLSKEIAAEILINNKKVALNKSILTPDGLIYVDFREVFNIFKYNTIWIKTRPIATGFNQIETSNGAKTDQLPRIFQNQLMVPIGFLMELTQLNTSNFNIIGTGQFIFTRF